MQSNSSRFFTVAFNVYSSMFWRHYYPVFYQRIGMSEIASLVTPPPLGVKTELFKINKIPAAWLIPEGCARDKVLLYFHGGAYTLGSIKGHKKMVSRIAREAGCKSLLIEYRLAPENKFPAALEDTVSSYKWLLDQGYKPENIVIGGDSAGGGLAIATLTSLRDSGWQLPGAAILLSPWVDLEMEDEAAGTEGTKDPVLQIIWLKTCAEMYLGGEDPKNPLVSPVNADLKGLPPMLIHIGSRETLLHAVNILVEHARNENVQVELKIWDGMFHVWQALSPFMPESRDSIRELGAYCKTRLSGV
ncbi:MAG: alpha/beta hydrolase [Actinobacteria bacterium]|nr:alpha/beta hydrolase [Actinomycetota bacterium]